MFQRPDNKPPQPQFTGTASLDDDTLKAIVRAGGACQIALWTRGKNGKPLKNRNGTYRFRLHIEPPWDEDDDDGDGSVEDDDFPF